MLHVALLQSLSPSASLASLRSKGDYYKGRAFEQQSIQAACTHTHMHTFSLSVCSTMARPSVLCLPLATHYSLPYRNGPLTSTLSLSPRLTAACPAAARVQPAGTAAGAAEARGPGGPPGAQVLAHAARAAVWYAVERREWRKSAEGDGCTSVWRRNERAHSPAAHPRRATAPRRRPAGRARGQD